MISLLASIIISGAVFNYSGEAKEIVDSSNQIRSPKVVYVHGEISESSARTFADNMKAAKDTGQTIIPIVISSYGGSVYALLEMIDVIKSIGVPVATIIKGKAMSAGGVLASCGAPGMRYISPNATFMIHEVSSFQQGKLGDLKADVNESIRLNRLIFSIMAENIGKSEDFILDMIDESKRTDIFLTAKEAKELGLVDHIGIPNINININVEIDIN